MFVVYMATDIRKCVKKKKIKKKKQKVYEFNLRSNVAIVTIQKENPVPPLTIQSCGDFLCE